MLNYNVKDLTPEALAARTALANKKIAEIIEELKGYDEEPGDAELFSEEIQTAIDRLARWAIELNALRSVNK